MAQRTVVTLIDDIDQTEATASVSFALDGVAYSVDLNDEHADELRAALAPYIAAGRKTSGPSARSGARRTRNTGPRSAADVRAWARRQGLDGVTERGRLPRAITDAYNAAH